jgi:hypothetical protein
MDRQLTQFQFASDLAKQLMTLATGTITLTFAFAKDFIKAQTPRLRGLMIWSWILFLISICAGAAHLMALTGELVEIPDEKAGAHASPTPVVAPSMDSSAPVPSGVAKERQENKEEPTIASPFAVWTSRSQIVTFLFGILLVTIFAASSIRPVANTVVETTIIIHKPVRAVIESEDFRGSGETDSE